VFFGRQKQRRSSNSEDSKKVIALESQRGLENDTSIKKYVERKGVWNGGLSSLSLCLSAYLSVCPSAWNNSAPTGQISMKFDIWVFFRKYVKNIQVSLKSDNNNGYLKYVRV
jgi:hypothetical protein